MTSNLGKVENIVGKGENAGYNADPRVINSFPHNPDF